MTCQLLLNKCYRDFFLVDLLPPVLLVGLDHLP